MTRCPRGRTDGSRSNGPCSASPLLGSWFWPSTSAEVRTRLRFTEVERISLVVTGIGTRHPGYGVGDCVVVVVGAVTLVAGTEVADGTVVVDDVVVVDDDVVVLASGLA